MNETRAVPEVDVEVVREQLQKLEDDTNLTSASDFWLSQSWEVANTWLGLSIVLVSGIVTVLGAASALKFGYDLQQYITFCSTIFAAIATVIGSVLTFLKPSERAGRYREFGNKFKALRNRIRIYRTVIIYNRLAETSPAEQLVAFSNEKDSLNSDNPPIPRSAFLRASRDILEKYKRRSKLDAASIIGQPESAGFRDP